MFRFSLNESLPHKRKRRWGAGGAETSKALASMKVFRISGRDLVRYGAWLFITLGASMKVFRISGRDWQSHAAASSPVTRLNESLPHKRKRHSNRRVERSRAVRLNESLPHKRKRRYTPHTNQKQVARLNESLPHKRKRRWGAAQ